MNSVKNLENKIQKAVLSWAKGHVQGGILRTKGERSGKNGKKVANPTGVRPYKEGRFFNKKSLETRTRSEARHHRLIDKGGEGTFERRRPRERNQRTA